MRAFHEQIAPLNHAADIKVPLLVVQGKNDPRVPYTEAEQIVAAVRKNGCRSGTCWPTTKATAFGARPMPTSSSTPRCAFCKPHSCGK